MFNFIKKNFKAVIAIFFTLLGLYLRFVKLAGRELWTDELWQLAQTTGPFKPIWHRLIVTDFTSFPGAYLLNWPFVKLFGTSKWAINIPNYLITLFGFYLFYLICRRYLKTSVGFFVAFLIFCFNGILIYHSFEFRPYAVLPTLSLGSFYFAEIIACRWRMLPALKKLLLALFFIFVIIYHVFGIMIAGLCLIYFIVLEAKKRGYASVFNEVKSFILYTGIPAILLFIWYASGTKWQEVQNGTWQPFDYFPSPAMKVHRFIRQVLCSLRGNKQFGQKYMEMGIWLSFLIPHKDRFRQIWLFLLIILLPVEIILVLAIWQKYWFLDRQLIWIMPLYAFFLGWCWDCAYIYIKQKILNKVKANKQFHNN